MFTPQQHYTVRAYDEPAPLMSARPTGAKKTDDEEAYELFLSLYNARAWGAWSGGSEGYAGTAMHSRRLLRRLGLDHREPTSINSTLAAVMDLVEGSSKWVPA